MPVTLVTGTSTGIGLATALHFARHGHQVVATMRNLAKAGPLETAARDEKLPVVVRELDVTRPLRSSVRHNALASSARGAPEAVGPSGRRTEEPPVDSIRSDPDAPGRWSALYARPRHQAA